MRIYSVATEKETVT